MGRPLRHQSHGLYVSYDSHGLSWFNADIVYACIAWGKKWTHNMHICKHLTVLILRLRSRRSPVPHYAWPLNSVRKLCTRSKVACDVDGDYGILTVGVSQKITVGVSTKHCCSIDTAKLTKFMVNTEVQFFVRTLQSLGRCGRVFGSALRCHKNSELCAQKNSLSACTRRQFNKSVNYLRLLRARSSFNQCANTSATPPNFTIL